MRNSMTQQRRFTKEFEEEAVRLVQTSGRTQRAIAGDLGNWALDAGSLDRPEPGSARCRPIGSNERYHGGAEAAATGERDPSAGAGHPAAANGTTWFCWHMSGRPLPCRTAPMAVPE